MTDVNKDISMFLDEKVMKTFCVAKSFKDNDGGRVNSLHFSWNGLSLITSSEDDQIVIYDCERGDQKRLVNSQKYGVDLARFTHGQDSFTARLLDKHNSSKNMLYCQNLIFWFSYQDLRKLFYFYRSGVRPGPAEHMQAVGICCHLLLSRDILTL